MPRDLRLPSEVKECATRRWIIRPRASDTPVVHYFETLPDAGTDILVLRTR